MTVRIEHLGSGGFVNIHVSGVRWWLHEHVLSVPCRACRREEAADDEAMSWDATEAPPLEPPDLHRWWNLSHTYNHALWPLRRRLLPRTPEGYICFGVSVGKHEGTMLCDRREWHER